MDDSVWKAVSPYNPELHLEGTTIYDTTLRDGEQAPGVRFSREQKVEIAEKLEELGIPEIEAGFPVVSREEKGAVKEIAGMGLDARTTALARVRLEDIDAVIDCGTNAVTIFAPVSPFLLEHKMHMEYGEVVELSVEAVEYAREHGLGVAFSAEDSTRTDLKKLVQLYKNVEGAGAARVHIADTVGAATPQAMEFMVKEVRGELKTETQLCVHCHNDFGFAVANTVQGLSAGATAAAATVNGIGERAGNTSLEELLAALRVLYDMDLRLNMRVICELSRLVERYSGIKKPPHKPLVGSNVFAHESGIHVAAVLENPLSYEPFLPSIIGQRRKIVLGKHSGRRSIEAKLKDYDLITHVEGREILLQAVKENREGGSMQYLLREITRRCKR